MKILYSINEYDKDGDITEKGIFLHFQNTRILIAKDKNELNDFIELIQYIKNDIKEEED